MSEILAITLSLRCNNLVFSDAPDSDGLHDLILRGHKLGLEIVSAGTDSVHVYTDAHSAESLEEVGLGQCVRLAGVRDLLRNELRQNWHKLNHRTEDSSLLEEIEGQPHHIEQRSTEDSECVVDGKCNGKEDKWFTEYVSLYHTALGKISYFEKTEV